ncbi:MAG: hypothetical protein ACU0CI_08700 [Shimia sp.]
MAAAGFVLAASFPTVSLAQSVEEQVVLQLQNLGYTDIVLSRTFLGRLRVIAERPGRVREIVLNPSTGEVLRDLVRSRPLGAPSVVTLPEPRPRTGREEEGGERAVPAEPEPTAPEPVQPQPEPQPEPTPEPKPRPDSEPRPEPEPEPEPKEPSEPRETDEPAQELDDADGAALEEPPARTRVAGTVPDLRASRSPQLGDVG